MKIEDFLSSDAYTPVNKALSRHLWFICAWFLWELIRQRKRFGWWEFYYSQEEMEKDIGISAYMQRTSIATLVEKWCLIVTKKWIPCKNWYIIVDEAIFNLYIDDEKVVENKLSKFWQLDVKNLTTGCENFDNYSNKKDNKKDIIKDEPIFFKLWETICTKKWGDEGIGAKEYEKKIAQWVDAEDMIKSASLDKFEIREWICDITYTKNKQNWIKTYTKQSEDVIESRIISILRARYERYVKWTKFRENTVTDLQELFWKEYISWLWKLVQQQYKEQHF